MPPLSRNTAFKPPRPSLGDSRTLDGNQTKSTSRNVEYVSSSESEQGDRRNIGKHPQPAKAAPDGSASQKTPAIPRKVLVSLLHEHFKNRDTRITKEAMSYFSAYIDIFVNEAIQRAVQERRNQDRSSTTSFFLEVEDLEKLAPQLLLDF